MAEAEFVSNSPIRGDELLIGCGRARKKNIAPAGTAHEWQDLVTLDADRSCDPDVVWDLDHLPLPFEDNTFREIHAYEVLEHCGRQGDYRSFFALFEELHRILKPGGLIVATCPPWHSLWAWGDPGHTRVINEGTLHFLSQSHYEDAAVPMTDYRSIYKADFRILHSAEYDKQGQTVGPDDVGVGFAFVLEAVKDGDRE